MKTLFNVSFKVVDRVRASFRLWLYVTLSLRVGVCVRVNCWLRPSLKLGID